MYKENKKTLLYYDTYTHLRTKFVIIYLFYYTFVIYYAIYILH